MLQLLPTTVGLLERQGSLGMIELCRWVRPKGHTVQIAPDEKKRETLFGATQFQRR